MDQNENKVPTPEEMFDAMMANGEKALANLAALSKNAVQLSEQLLLDILRENADTEYGMKHNFADIHTIEEYRQRVPYSTYDEYADYIRRMYTNGERGLAIAIYLPDFHDNLKKT